MTEPDLLRVLRDCLPGAAAFDPQAGDPALAGPGAYALLLHLAAPVAFARRGMGAATLQGWHVYAGSARGSGGMAARLRRHFRQGKPVHWHVDELTNAADRIAALAMAGGSECDIVDRLLRSGRFGPALAGFGSSDCRRCTAHLLRPL